MGKVSSWLTSNLAERGRRWKRVPCGLHTHSQLWRSFPSSQKTHGKGSHHSSLSSLSQPVALCLRHTHAWGHTHPALAYFQGLPSTWGKRDQNLPLTHTRPSWSGHWTSLQPLAQLHISSGPAEPLILKKQKNTGHCKYFIIHFPPLNVLWKIPHNIFFKITWYEYTNGLPW